MEKLPQYLTEKQVSESTGLSQKTLSQHRWKSTGLPYSKFGRSIRYKFDDVLAFMEAGRVEPETSNTH
jgi:hypothetical protein